MSARISKLQRNQRSPKEWNPWLGQEGWERERPRGPAVACGSQRVKRCPGPEALRLRVGGKQNGRHVAGGGVGSAALLSGIFRRALFFKGITQLPAAATTERKARFRGCRNQGSRGSPVRCGRSVGAEGRWAGPGLLRTPDDPVVVGNTVPSPASGSVTPMELPGTLRGAPTLRSLRGPWKLPPSFKSWSPPVRAQNRAQMLWPSEYCP